jgi:hypothetical protein
MNNPHRQRETALAMAIQTAPPGEYFPRTIERAQAFLDFIEYDRLALLERRVDAIAAKDSAP